MAPACPAALGRMFTDPHQPPHFNGAFADYYHVSPRMALFKVPDTVTDTMVAGANCALAQVIYGLERIGVRFGDTVVIQGAGGSAPTPPPWPRSGAPTRSSSSTGSTTASRSPGPWGPTPPSIKESPEVLGVGAELLLQASFRFAGRRAQS